jgi:hypothetical protein
MLFFSHNAQQVYTLKINTTRFIKNVITLTMKLKLSLKFTFYLSLLVLMNSCGSLVKNKAENYVTVEKGAIPENFGAGNTTMLFIVKSKKSYDKYLVSNIEEVYNGKYELITNQELLSAKYQNLKEYPYYLDFNLKTYQRYSRNSTIHGPGGGFTTSSLRQFYIKDRRSEKEYKMKMTSGYWSKLQRVYIENMEAERLKNISEL